MLQRVDRRAPEAGRLIAIDRKTLCRSHDRQHALEALHVVSAMASDQDLSLGRLAIEEKSSEITAIPELVEQIEVKHTVVTLDAIGGRKEIAKKTIDTGGDYVLALYANHEKLHEAVGEHFDELHEDDSRKGDCRR